MSESRSERIRARLAEVFAPEEIEVRDDSHLHVGHPGAAGGGGHFHVYLNSRQFAGKPLLERHRLVYDALGGMMHTDIHALSLKAIAPGERL
jgi:BolA protein